MTLNLKQISIHTISTYSCFNDVDDDEKEKSEANNVEHHNDPTVNVNPFHF